MNSVGDREITREAERDAPASAGWSRVVAPAVIITTGALLSATYLPMLYNQFRVYDDEGSLLLMLREFLHRGSLYHHTSAYYGPFYYTVFGGLYRILNIAPTPFNGRFIVLVLTGLAATVFAATVYRLTHSLAAALLCEVASFITLVGVAGVEPTHPASLLMVLLGLLLYCLTSNCITPRPSLLAVAGFATAAIVMTKINVGVFVVGALLIWLLVGGRAVPVRLRIGIIGGATLFPFALMEQNISQAWVAVYAMLVALSLLLVCAVAVSGLPLQNEFKIMPFAAGAALTVVASVAWPLLHGTTIGYLANGVFIRPLNQANALTIPAVIKLSWPMFLLCVVGVALATLWRDPRIGDHTITDGNWLLALGITGVAVLGLGSFGSFLGWMPVVVLIPMLARFVKTERTAYSILVLTVAIAVLQALHAYPVAGSQIAWSTAAMFLPCSIAIGVYLHRSSEWKRLTVPIRVVATIALCSFLVVEAGFWPLTIWHDYLADPPLNLPGTSLVRFDPGTTETLQLVTASLVQHCDTFYSVPPSDSFYIYTKIPSPTGLVIDNSGVLNTSEQLEIAASLNAAVERGERVCILREANGYPTWAASTTGTGPLGVEVSSFSQAVDTIANYSIWTKGT